MRSLRRMRPIARHARVAGSRPAGNPVAFGVLAHRAQLEDVERPAGPTGALLREEDRQAVIRRDGQHRDQDHRQCQNQQNHRCDDIERALDESSQRALLEALAVDEPARLQRVHGHLAPHALVKGRQVADGDAVDATLEQVIHRQRAAALLACRNDHFVDAEAFDNRLQPQVWREHRRAAAADALGVFLLPGSRVEPDNHRAPRPVFTDQFLDRVRVRSGPDDQCAAQPEAACQRGNKDRTNQNDAGERE